MPPELLHEMLEEYLAFKTKLMLHQCFVQVNL